MARQHSDAKSSPAGAGPDAAAAELPSLARRFGALLVDWALCLLVARLFGADLARDGWPPVAVLIIEYGLFIGLFAQTPGMWVAKIRCISYADGGAIGIGRALLRGLLLSLVIPALIMNGQLRGLHDRAAGSIMVYAPSARR